MQDEYLRHEKIQIVIRLVFITISMISIYCYYFYTNDTHVKNYTLSEIFAAPLFVVFINFIYLYMTKKFPYKLQKQRIIFSVIIDICLTVYVMFLVDALAAYYAGALLWFSIGYGMRYGKKIAYLAYFTILIAWIVLLYSSTFWLNNLEFGIGWLLTFIILPLYYFRLVTKLHQNIKILHLYARKYEHKAFHDQLTGLSNRTLFNQELREFIQYFNLHHEKFALFFIDLDSFKNINDIYGHDMGDKVLVEASKRLKSVIEHTYRLGGDEFVSIYKYREEYE